MRHVGIARIDKRTKDLVKRLDATNIAIIDHEDMDRVSAESLVDSGVEVVINAARSISGAYPNVGPLILARGGVTLIDDVGQVVFDIIREGENVVVDGEDVYRGDELIAHGKRLTVASIESAMEDAKENIGERLDEFARNTLEYLEKEKEILSNEMWVPNTRTTLFGRQVLVVVRGYDFKEDLRTLSSYIREMKPALIGVDGGADALLEEGFKPDIIIGDMDSVTDAALTCGAELIVHAYADGRAPGMERLDNLGVGKAYGALTWPLAATSEDLALLLGWESGADLIVAVGTHANLVEYLDKGRKGMASSFLVRLKVGPKLVDAKGVNKLYRSSVSPRQIFPLIMAALFVIAVLVYISPAARATMSLIVLQIRVLLNI